MYQLGLRITKKIRRTLPYFFKYIFLSFSPIILATTSESITDSSSSLELGTPKIQYFDTRNLGYHRQNFSIKHGADNRIYVVNRVGIIVYDGVKWDSITPKNNEVLYWEIALSNEGKVYAGEFNDFGYYQGQKNGQWEFISLSLDKERPDFTGIGSIAEYDEHVIYLSRDYLFYYHPDVGVKWVQRKRDKFNRVFVVGGEFYVATVGSTVYRYNKENNKLEEFSLFNQIPEFHLKAVAPFGENHILFASNNGIYRYNKSNKQIIKFDRGATSWFEENDIRSLRVLDDGRILLGSKKKGLAILNSEGETTRILSKKHGLRENWISDIVEDQNGDIWLSHGSQGVSRVEIDDNSFFGRKLGIDKLQSIAKYQSRLFVGSLTQGLSVQEKANDLMEQSYFKDIGEYSSVWSLWEHTDGLFVGHSYGIALVKENDNKELVNESIIETDTIYELIQSQTHANVIYGAGRSGLIKLEKIDDRWISKGYLNNFSLDLVTGVSDQYNNLWLTSHSRTIARVSDLKTWPNNHFKQYAEPELYKDSNTIMRIGNELVLENNSGYFTSDREGEILPFHGAQKWPADLKRVFHRHYQIDERSTLATNGNRVFRVSVNENQNYLFDDIAYNRVRTEGINALYVDNEGATWIGGSNGLVKVQRDFTASDIKLFSPHVNRVSSLHSGAVYFSSANFGMNKISTPLSAESQELSINFGTLDYREGENLIYRYQLKGMMDSWSKWSKQTRADFTNLPHGSFQFELQSKNNLGMESDVVSFSFSRLPFWYQTHWFFIALLVFIACFLFILGHYVVKRRTRLLTLRAQQLEETVNKRTETIVEQTKELKRLNKVRTRFFTNVSHELRTPLTLTIAPLEEISDKDYNGDLDTTKKGTKLALKSARGMLALLNQVLDLSRMESGALSLALKSVEVVGAAKSLVEPFESFANKKQIKLVQKYNKDSFELALDPKGLKSIVDNLLSNAFKFTPKKGEITFQLFIKDESIEIEVSDTGCGIQEQELPHIFDQYYQAESKQDSLYSGTGIGLAMLREYVELHGGEVSVDSQINLGTSFKVVLPIISTNRVSELYPSSVKSDGFFKALPELNSQTTRLDVDKLDTGSDDCPVILVVEDNDELRGFLVNRLSESYHVVQAENGQQGLKMAQEHLPDVVISDIMMPLMNGYELCDAIKSNYQTDFIPFVMLTSKGTGENIVEGINLGADDYLAKPFSMPELFARVNRLIESRKLLRKRFSEEVSASASKQDYQSFSENDKFLSDIRKVVFSDGYESLTVNELAEAMSMDRTTLYRKIKKITGKPPADAIRTIRLDEAAKLFSSRQSSVTEVAYSVGFKCVGHFSRSFSKYFGESPSDYKLRQDA